MYKRQTEGAPSEEEVELARARKEQAQEEMARASAAAGEFKGQAEAQRSELERQAELCMKDRPFEDLADWLVRKGTQLKEERTELRETYTPVSYTHLLRYADL